MSSEQTWRRFPKKFYCIETPGGYVSWYLTDKSYQWKHAVERSKEQPVVYKLWVWNVGEVDRTEYIPE